METYVEDVGLIDLMVEYLNIPEPLAWKYYEKMRDLWFNARIPEPNFVVVDMIENRNVIGVFYEEHWRNNKIFLTDNMFDFNDSGKLFYLTHEIVHFMDFHLHGRCRSESETDALAIKFLTSWEMW